MAKGKRSLVVLLCTAALLVAGALPIPVLAGETRVTLSCDDGTELDLALDAEGLVGVKNAVEAMTLYPAGLTCKLSETSLLSALGAGVAHAAGGPKDFVVGGGQLLVAGCIVNFAISAHVPANTESVQEGQAAAGGTLNLKFQNAVGCREGHLVAKVDCVVVLSPTQAEFTALVTRSTESFLPYAEGTRVAVEVLDLDPAPDRYNDNGSPGPCGFSAFGTGAAGVPVLRGNIEIHDN
jgi:hypothetical protein